MESRVFLAILLSFLVFVAWGAFITKKEAAYLKSIPQQEKSQPDRNAERQGVPQKPSQEIQKTKRIQEDIKAASDLGIIRSANIKEVLIETDLYQLSLTNEGASIKNLKLKKHLDKNKQPLELIAQIEGSVRPPYLSTLDSSLMDVLNFSIYSTEALSDTLSENNPSKTISFVLETPQGLKVKKDFTFYYDRYQIDLDISLTDQKGDLANRKYYVNWGPGFGNETETQLYVFVGPISYLNNQTIRHDADDIQNEFIFSGDLSWVCLQNKYFTSALIPPKGMDAGRISKNPNDKLSVGLQLINNSSSSVRGNITIYAGPKEEDLLKSYNVHLEEAIDFGWFGNKFSFIVRPLIKALRFFYGYTHNYGVSIILITVIIKIIFFPLTQKSMKSMKGMQKVQPYIKIIQERYKNDRKQLNQEMMKIYKEHKINPLGGCMPMLLQIPVFIALYNALLVSIELRGAHFAFWIHDLSEKDPYYITPVLMGVSMLVQQKMTPTVGDPMQAKIMMFLPIIFTFMFLKFPSGLVIYWLVNNVLSIAQQYYINKHVTN